MKVIKKALMQKRNEALVNRHKNAGKKKEIDPTFYLPARGVFGISYIA
jgi:hypothetical protein